MKFLKILVTVSIGILICIGVLWKVAKQPSFQFFGELLYRVETEEKVVALTFDDGPSPNNTRDILAILKDFDIHATFFMIGQNIEKYPDLAEEVLNAGHQIANHSYSHQRTLLRGVGFFRSEILKTDVLIQKLGFKEDIVFRPPFGKKLFSLPLALKELDKLSVTWDADSEDTETQDLELLKRNVLSQVRPGSIILFHDGFAAKPGTKEAVRAVVEALKAQGYQFQTINQMRQQSAKITSL